MVLSIGSIARPAALTDLSILVSAAPQAETTPPGAAPSSTVSADGMIPTDRLRWHIPDPEHDRANAEEALKRARESGDKTEEHKVARVAERVNEIRRDKQLRLTLDEAVRIALENNYDVQVARYNPAIDTTRIVEAQAAFDAVFFTNLVKNRVDRPTGSRIVATNLDSFQSSYGVQKVLPSGMTVSGQYQLNRTDIVRRRNTASTIQGFNPEYTSNLVLEMRQPMLRGFGIDYNRSAILVARNDRRISFHTFERQVRDTLRQVDELYWRLVQARRDVTITARLLADFQAIYEYLEARQQFDITPVQLAATRANLEQAKADFINRRANVYNAEDRLVSLMNAQNINLADETEIIPEDLPQTPRLVVDRLAEVQAALDNREEIKEQQLRVASAELLVGRAKNAELPRFDLTFRTTYDGLAQNADRAFDEMSRSKFIEYFVGVEFEMPIGNRGPRAARLRAGLQHQQQIAQLKSTLEKIILDVNLTVRTMDTAFDQIVPSFEAAQAREREVDSIVARAERKDINTLTTELSARQSLAAARRAMLGAMVEYNISIVDLERAKGTLLKYHNVVIPNED